MKIYLAGAMTGLTKQERNDWRLQAKMLLKDYKANVINPCDFYDFDIVDSTTTEREIMDFDLFQVRESDLILVDFRHPNSIGTAMELMLAFELRIPIIAFGNNLKAVHPWFIEVLTKHCPTLENAIDYLINYYIRGNV